MRLYAAFRLTRFDVVRLAFCSVVLCCAILFDELLLLLCGKENGFLGRLCDLTLQVFDWEFWSFFATVFFFFLFDSAGLFIVLGLGLGFV